MSHRPKEACGVFGIFGAKEDAAPLIFLGLHALQHRGQDSAGLVTLNQGELYSHNGLGLVANVFADKDKLKMPGTTGIGHVLYSRGNRTDPTHVQPIIGRYKNHVVALGHNGALASAPDLRNRLIARGSLFHGTSDSELLLHMLAQRQASSNEEIANVLSDAGPAFAILMLFDDNRLIAARDPWGFRPLALGKLNGAYVVASESCAFDQVGADFVRELEAGEMLVIEEKGLSSYSFAKGSEPQSRCLLELIYFARPDSYLFGETPHIMRERSGAVLAKEHPADVDVVVAIPDSGMSAAMGFASQMGIRFERGLIRNHYVGRSFIAPNQEARVAAVRMKHNIVRDVVKGKRVALVDDSLIRGTTTHSLNQALREAGAKEVHLRIACPPTRHPCPYGIDFPRRENLLANKRSVEDIRKLLGIDSLGYLSLEGITGLFGEKSNSFCTACWSGDYKA